MSGFARRDPWLLVAFAAWAVIAVLLAWPLSSVVYASLIDKPDKLSLAKNESARLAAKVISA